MLRKCRLGDAQNIYFIINEAVKAYEDVIPAGYYPQPGTYPQRQIETSVVLEIEV